jgi:hypothetical protein
LTAGVQKRLIADAKVGFLLSGGLDSSLVCAIAARESRVPIRTFAIGMSEDAIDLKYAKQVADYIGAELYDCDGNILASYGGWLGCYGLCDITRTYETVIYQREKTEEEILGEAIHGEWACLNNSEIWSISFSSIEYLYGAGNVSVEGWDHKAKRLVYSITSDSLHLRPQASGSNIKEQFEYDTHYTMINDTLTIDNFSLDGSVFNKITLVKKGYF